MLKKIGIAAFLLMATTAQAIADGHVVSEQSEGTAAVGAVAHAAAEHTSGGLPQLDTSTYVSQVFWLVIVFSFMYLVFSKKTVPQIGRTIENRAERISSDLDSAERLKNEVSELQRSYEEKLVQAREESYAAFTNAEKEIKDEAERHASEFHVRASKKIKEMEKNIDAARTQAIDDMSAVAAGIAIQATEKIIGVKADEKMAKKIVDSLNKKAA